MNPTLLVAEDDEADVFLLRRAFRLTGFLEEVAFVRDGQEAIDFLLRQREAPDDRLPGLLVLDLKMPRRSGFEVLHWVREQPVLRCLPAIIFSSADRREDVERAYALGASAFLIKPPGIAERAELAGFLRDWLRFNQRPLASREGFREGQSVHLARCFEKAPSG